MSLLLHSLHINNDDDDNNGNDNNNDIYLCTSDRVKMVSLVLLVNQVMLVSPVGTVERVDPVGVEQPDSLDLTEIKDQSENLVIPALLGPPVHLVLPGNKELLVMTVHLVCLAVLEHLVLLEREDIPDPQDPSENQSVNIVVRGSRNF